MTNDDFFEQIQDEESLIQKKVKTIFEREFGETKLPPSLNCSQLSKALSSNKTSEEELSKILQSLRLRVNCQSDEYVKYQITKEYVDADMDLMKLLSHESQLVRGYTLSLIHTLLGYSYSRRQIL